MVADEPTNGELARRLDQIQGQLREYINQGEYGEFRRGLDLRVLDLQRAFDDLRRTFQERDESLRAWADEEFRKINSAHQWRVTLMMTLLPTLVALLGIIVTVVLKGKG